MRVWSLAGRAESARLEHDGEVWGATFVRDAEQVVSFEDQTARIWSPLTGTTAELTYSTANAGGIIQSAALSPDGRRLATRHFDGSVVLWDLEAAQQHVAMEHDTTASAVTFSPDGTRLATASADNTARIWNAENGRELARLAHDDEVRAVAFSPDGTLLATASADETVRVWAVETGQREACDWSTGIPSAPSNLRATARTWSLWVPRILASSSGIQRRALAPRRWSMTTP